MIATTIEQSKYLLELGLDPKTADMYYTGHRSIYNPKEIEYTQVPRVRAKFVSFDRLEVFFPAWSLQALLEVMPSSIRVDGFQYYHHLEKNNEFYTVSYYFDDIDELYTLYNTKVCESPIDAAYEMVCWLLEQGLIKE